MAAGNDSRKVSYCGAAHWCFLPAGNCSHKVSYWSDTQWCFMTTGNDSRRVSYCGAAHWCFLSAGNCSTGDFSTPLRCARNDREGEYHCVSYRQETVGERFPIVVLCIGVSYRQETIQPEISGLRFAALEMTMKGTRHSVISSGAACRNGSSGIGTMKTLSREISRLHAFCAIAERVQCFHPSK